MSLVSSSITFPFLLSLSSSHLYCEVSHIVIIFTQNQVVSISTKHTGDLDEVRQGGGGAYVCVCICVCVCVCVCVCGLYTDHTLTPQFSQYTQPHVSEQRSSPHYPAEEEDPDVPQEEVPRGVELEEEEEDEVDVPELSSETSAQLAERLLKELTSGVCAREYALLQSVRSSRSSTYGR